MVYRYRFVLFFLVLTSTCGFSQGVYKFSRADSVSVLQNSVSLANPWAGGMNFMLVGEMDLDFDGIKDLVFFDKSGFKLLPFLKQGSSYSYAPSFRNRFPSMKEWFVLRDYDGDGRMDIFTYYSGGAKVYRNVGSVSTGLVFEEVVNLLQSDYESVYTSIFVPSTDVPGIADMDLDGDLDFLTFDVFGGCVDYHKNMSMELFGHTDSLRYELESRNWGNFTEDAFSNNVILNDDCERSGLRHAGSTFLVLDVNGDSKKDVLLGDINYNNLVLLLNDGTQISQSQANFPLNYGGSPQVNLTVFPAASYLDLDNDGKKDLIASPTAEGRSENKNSVWWYKNTGYDSLPNFQLQGNSFLQNTMIDLGEGAYPVFVDYDGDGLTDMVVGNYGYFVNTNNYNGRLHAFKNIGTATEPAFRLESSDFAGISSANLDALVPTFGDLDADGDLDLIVGEVNGRLHYYVNTGTSTNPQYSLQAANFSAIQEAQYSAPCLFDLNEDGKLDLLVGSRSGKLNYYENTGTPQIPTFSTSPSIANIGGVNVTDQTVSFYGYSVPFVFEDANNFQLFCGSYSGRIFHYKNLKGNLTGPWELVTDVVDSLVYDGFRTGVSVADINMDGKLDMVLGNYSGGLALFYGLIVNTSVHESALEVDAQVFPNPVTDVMQVLFRPELGELNISVYDLNGRLVGQHQLNDEHQASIDLSSLSEGVYLLVIRQKGQSPKAVKVVKVPAN